jgi:hypothetical protein
MKHRGYYFDERSARRIARVVRTVERQVDPAYCRRANRRNVYPINTGIHVRLTTFDSGTKAYDGITQQPDGTGHWEDTDPPETVEYVFERNDYIGIELGEVVELRHAGTVTVGSEEVPAWTFEYVKARETFDVVVAQTGGANGDETTQATWTYRVDNADGHVLATNKSPLFLGFRLSRGPVVAATRGIASYSVGGELNLLTVNEVHGNVLCEDA